MILPGTGRGTAPARRGGGGSSLRKPEVYMARKLRRTMSLPETILWRELRRRQLGVKVRRQHPIGPYVVDFYIPEWKLVIEVDGEAHNRGDQPLRDATRDAFLMLNGCKVFRVAARDILKNIDAVIEAIPEHAASPLHHPSDGPPPRAGEDL
jgi:very-short-patch-repair endonuclease